jgi:protein CpxP
VSKRNKLIRNTGAKEMRIRKISVSLLGLFLCAGLAIDQEPGQSQNDNAPAAQSAPKSPQRRPPDPARQARRLGKQLGLSQDQVSQIEPVIAGRQQQLENARTDPTLAPRQRRAEVRSIMRKSNRKIEAVMTDSQKQQYEQLLQARRQARRQRMQQPPQQQAPDQQAPQQQTPDEQAPPQPQQQ